MDERCFQLSVTVYKLFFAEHTASALLSMNHFLQNVLSSGIPDHIFAISLGPEPTLLIADVLDYPEINPTTPLYTAS